MIAFLRSFFTLTLEDILSDLTKKVLQLETHAAAKQDEALEQDAAAAAANVAAGAARVTANRALNVAAKLRALVS